MKFDQILIITLPLVILFVMKIDENFLYQSTNESLHFIEFSLLFLLLIIAPFLTIYLLAIGHSCKEISHFYRWIVLKL